MISKDQIKDLLGIGLSNTEVALAVGCDPSYISQLMADETFAAAVAVMRSAKLTDNSVRDASIDKAEDKLLKKLHEILDYDMIRRPMELIRSLQVVNQMKRRTAVATQNLNINQQIVQLMLPKAVRNEYVINAQGEVIEADGQTLITMPTHSLLKQLAGETSKDDGRSKVYEQLQRNLPGAS